MIGRLRQPTTFPCVTQTLSVHSTSLAPPLEPEPATKTHNRITTTVEKKVKAQRPEEKRNEAEGAISKSRGMFLGGRAAVLWPMILALCLTSNFNRNILPVAEALWLTIPGSGTKCVSEEIQNNVVVLADYYVIDENNPDHIPTVSARVTSPFGNNLHHNENATHGQFAFTTSESGNYLACFWRDGSHQQNSELTLGIDWKIGIAAKDWETVAKKEKIEGVELVLRRLEGAVQAIRGNLIYLRDREAEMREVSERTNARVAWFSIMSIGVCIVVSFAQLWYLKRYFIKKKLI